MSVIPFPMPNDLRQMELQVLNGADPDSVKGIERLWMWRLSKRKDEWAASERRFIGWIRLNPHGRQEA